MKKKYLPFIVLLLLAALLTVFTSCGKAAVPDIDEYVITRSDSASYEIRSECTDVWKAIRRLTGKELPIVLSSELDGSEKLIIVGSHPSGDYAAFTADMRVNDYAYGMSGDSFVIAGTSDETTALAAEEYCRYVRALYDSGDTDAPLIGPGVSFAHEDEYDLSALTVNSADIREYTVVYPRNIFIQKTLAEKISDTVLGKTGYSLGVMSDQDAGDGKRIYISIPDDSIDSDSYSITCGDDGSITVSGGSVEGLRCGVKLLCDRINAMEGSGELVISDGIVGDVKTLEPFKVMTFNILEFNAYLRIDAVVETILKYMPDSIGFQEASDSWMYELVKRIGEYYDFYHTIPIDEQPVFYLKDKWTLVEGTRLALSDTPEIDGTTVPGGQHPRSVYILLLERKSDGFRYYHVNTHFQPMNDGQKARASEASVVARLTDGLKDYPMFFTGDLNSSSTEEAHQILVGRRFYSSEALAEEKLVTGSSWCGDYYDINRTWSDRGSPIDYVYIKSPWVHTLTYKVIREPYGGMYPSDHFPVITEVEPIQ